MSGSFAAASMAASALCLITDALTASVALFRFPPLPFVPEP
jgi:hypothetical protein